jgi:hypothetical protein
VSGGERVLYYYGQNMEHEHTPFHPALMGEMALEGAIIRDLEEVANAQVGCSIGECTGRMQHRRMHR